MLQVRAYPHIWRISNKICENMDPQLTFKRQLVFVEDDDVGVLYIMCLFESLSLESI